MAKLADWARGLNRRGAGAKAGGIALLTDAAHRPDPTPLLPLLPRGSLVVLRDYGAADATPTRAGLVQACRARRLVALIADDLDAAVTLGAGLHLPEWRARNPGARVRLWHRRTGRQLTVSAHSRAALVRAAGAGADGAFLAPVFATASHPGGRSLGALRFRVLVRGARVPVWALGGMTKATVKRLGASGAAGVATVRGLDS